LFVIKEILPQAAYRSFLFRPRSAKITEFLKKLGTRVQQSKPIVLVIEKLREYGYAMTGNSVQWWVEREIVLPKES
jgi:hypothetical protein